MVRLQVSARVIPENSYLAYVDGGTQPSLFPGEKKLRITVGKPEDWPIGRLANEVRDVYARVYRRALGDIKYLKYDADDCDLDTEQRVYDVLFDEGRAVTDQRDQHVTIKIIQEQGRDVRAGSVVPDLNRPQYQTRRLPPTFAESSLGKHPRVPGGDDLVNKRQRLPEVYETQEPGLHTSIENDDDCAIVGESARPEEGLDHAHSSMSRARGLFYYTRPKSESPDTALPFGHIPHVATRDAFMQPPVSNIHGHAVLTQPAQNLESRKSRTSVNGHTSRAAQRQVLRQADNDTPLTPPSDTSRNGSSAETKAQAQAGVRKPASSPARPSGSSSKFKHASPQQSDIEDSQMSPRSKSSSRRSALQSHHMSGKQLFPSSKSNTAHRQVPQLVESHTQVSTPLQHRLGKTIQHSSRQEPENGDVEMYDNQIFVDRSADDSNEEAATNNANARSAKARQEGSDQLTTINGNARHHSEDVSTEQNDIDSNQENKRPTQPTSHSLGSSQSDLRGSAVKRPATAMSEETVDTPRRTTRHRKKKSRIVDVDDHAQDPSNHDVTGQSTPLDSPGEQLSQMQLEAQFAASTPAPPSQQHVTQINGIKQSAPHGKQRLSNNAEGAPTNRSLPPSLLRSPSNKKGKKPASGEPNAKAKKADAKQKAVEAHQQMAGQSTTPASGEEHTVQVPSTFEETPVPATNVARVSKDNDQRTLSPAMLARQESNADPVIPKGMTVDQYMKMRSTARDSSVEKEKKTRKKKVAAEKKPDKGSSAVAEKQISQEPIKEPVVKKPVAKPPPVAIEQVAKDQAEKEPTTEPVAKEASSNATTATTKAKKNKKCATCAEANQPCKLASPNDTTCIRCATNDIECSILARLNSRKARLFETCDACRKSKVGCRYPTSGSEACVRCSEKKVTCGNSLKHAVRQTESAARDQSTSSDIESVVSILNTTTKSAKSQKTTNKAAQGSTQRATSTPSVVIHSRPVASKTPAGDTRPTPQPKTTASSTTASSTTASSIQSTLTKPFTTPTTTPSLSSVKTMKDLKALQAAQAAQEKEEERLRSSQKTASSSNKPQFAVSFDLDSDEDETESDSDEPSLPKKLLTAVLDRSVRDPTPESESEDD